MTGACVAALNIYPVKGCGGIDLSAAIVTATGLAASGAGDREWMIIDREARFVTQRQMPRLALLRIAVTGDALVLTAPPSAARLTVPLSGNRAAPHAVQVWESHVRGCDEGDVAAAWLTDYLGIEVRLVRFDRTVRRDCNPEYAGDSGAHTMFADGYPYLVIGSASLAELNARLAARGEGALPMNRFRPNIVLDGLDAFAEDYVDTIDVEGTVLRLVKPCTRCQVTTTDQVTAIVGVEPLQTLGEYRMNEQLGGVTFGMNAVAIGGTGRTIARGAQIRVSYRF
jgi:uncharacterized protein